MEGNPDVAAAGDLVELYGLSRSDLNGLSGTVVTTEAGRRGDRLGVRLGHTGTTKLVAVRLSNVRLLESAAVRKLTNALSQSHIGEAAAASSRALDLLGDEVIVERILELIQVKVQRINANGVQRALATAQATILSASRVNRVWRAAAAKPMLAVQAERQLVPVVMASQFLGMRRAEAVSILEAADDCGFKGSHGSTWAALRQRDRDTCRWIIGGYENGLNSVLCDATGSEPIERIAAQTFMYLVRNGVPGPFLVVSTRSRWAQWQQVLPSTGLQVIELHSSTDNVNAITMRLENLLGSGCTDTIVLLPSEPPDEVVQLSLNDQVGSDEYPDGDYPFLSSGFDLKATGTIDELFQSFAVFDERSQRQDLLLPVEWRLTPDNMGFLLDGGSRCWLRLTDLTLSSDLTQLHKMFFDLNNGRSMWDPGKLWHLFDAAKPACAKWAETRFLVPRLHEALRQAYYREEQHAPELIATTELDALWAFPHPLVHRRVMLVGLIKEELNGKRGTVLGFDEERQKLVVHVDAYRWGVESHRYLVHPRFVEPCCVLTEP